MARSAIDTSPVRAAVLTAVRRGYDRAEMILAHPDVAKAIAKLPPKRDPFRPRGGGRRFDFRYVDGALQALKRAGEVKFDSRRGWRPT